MIHVNRLQPHNNQTIMQPAEVELTYVPLGNEEGMFRNKFTCYDCFKIPLGLNPVNHPFMVPEDYTANTRTQQAWTRTALYCIFLGVALARFGFIGGESEVSGVIFIATGGLVWIYAGFRYRRVLNLLKLGSFEVNRTGVLLAFMALFLATMIELSYSIRKLIEIF